MIDVDAVLELIGDRRLVLLGEASHGTHEFYAERARITRRLIEERAFDAVAVEADWPDAARVDRFVRHTGEDTSAADALGDFRRFPAWMWRNTVVRDFVEWLRDHNAANPAAGFYGIDLYSLRTSIDALLRYLDSVEPDAARRARERYACFDHADGQRYGYETEVVGADPCEDDAVEQLVELQRRADDRPQTERWSHYFHTRLTQQFDALIHIDETTAVEPLDRSELWVAGEPPETYPSGL